VLLDFSMIPEMEVDTAPDAENNRENGDWGGQSKSKECQADQYAQDMKHGELDAHLAGYNID